MDQQSLAYLLKRMCDERTRETTPGRAQKKTMVHLFGILFAKEIEECDGTPTRTAREVALKAGLSAGHATEINNGRLLAEYVTVDERSILKWRA